MAFTRDQTLNKYYEMLINIYGPTQNYYKSNFEILAHLSEVTGLAGKYLFKKLDNESAIRFIPKIFAWSCALLKKLDHHEIDLERIVLQKFPACCPYCLKKPCGCWEAVKPSISDRKITQHYYDVSRSQKRTINDFALMFAEIYGDSWESKNRKQTPIAFAYIRLTEELAELSEAVRFYHIYPKNFENELADFFAWWFALSHLIRLELKAETGENRSTEDLVWEAYPGRCRDCHSAPCFCPQGPVRELMSKPAPGQSHEIDGLTALRNQDTYKQDIAHGSDEGLALPSPISCIRCDVDNFKKVNTDFGHDAGDAALKHIATVLRNKARQRDRLYRVGGDEFALMMPDTTEEEAKGLMIRVLKNLADQPVRWVNPEGKAFEFEVSISVGVAECGTATEIEAAFAHADKAAETSKNNGKGQVSIWQKSQPGRRIDVRDRHAQ